MKILFVDDEQAILRTLRRTLRNLPASYRIDFESDPLAAIERLHAGDYALVVSDMRMPGRDGCEVLEAAARYNPGCVRAILSGYSGEEATARVAHYAHLFIGKPFDPKTITDLIERAEALRSMPLPESLRQRLGGLGALPPIPKLFLILRQVLTDTDRSVSLDDIAALIVQDIALSAKILQLANSAFIGVGTRVNRVDQAVKLLGVRLISGLVVQHELFSKSALPAALEPWREQLNQESLAAGDLAARIAREHGMRTAKRDEASLAGLLHDVGRLVLACESLHSETTEHTAPPDGDDDLFREEALFGVHHGWVGAYLLRLWGFSQSVVDAVAWHHQPSDSGITGFSTLTLVHVADALLRDPDTPQLDLAYLGELGCLDALPRWTELAQQCHSDDRPVGH